jgi:transcriptional regulator with XRE-family HTH domain
MKEAIYLTIGEKIRHCRKLIKMTQPTLASRLGKSLRMVQNYESDVVTPSLDMLKKIAAILGVNTVDFMEWEHWEQKEERDTQEYRAIKAYLENAGYMVDERPVGVSDECHVDYDGSGAPDKIYYEHKLTKDDKIATFDEDELAELDNAVQEAIQNAIAPVIEAAFYKKLLEEKSQKKKPSK